jgi:polyisoprenoid-binding protein YceI
MKKLTYLLSTILLSSLFACNTSSTEDDDAPVEKDGQKHELNIETSQIRWFGEKVKGTEITGSHNGTIKFNSGYVLIDNGIIKGGEFEINMDSMEEDGKDIDRESSKKLIGHLKSEDFFETKKYPTATLKIINGDKESITGLLTVRGIESEITMPVQITNNADQLSIGCVFDADFSPFKVPSLGGNGEYISNKIGFRVVMFFDKN